MCGCFKYCLLLVLMLFSCRAVSARETVDKTNIYLKTNLLGWCAAVANVSVEVDCSKHWSVALPVGYSAWNYMKTTVKMRTLAFHPELRYWLSENNDGFYTGAHLGIGSYNFAFDGDYRYQDHDRRTPAYGGGISVGYRKPVARDSRWFIEFSLGAGAYKLHYDVFRNVPETTKGLLVNSVKKVYWGIDQASITFSYSFNIKDRSWEGK